MNLSQKTRNESYRLIEPSLMPKQKAVYDCISLHGSISNRMLSVKLGLAINSVTGRTTELVELKLVEAAGKFWDATTKRHVVQWKIKTSEPQMKLL